MAKRPTKQKTQQPEPTWYTVGWSYPEPLRGGAVGGSLEVHAKDEAEAQATVEGKLRAKGHTWKDITIVKGRDPGLTRKGGTERHYAELQAMLGIGRLALHAWSDVEPRPMWASPDIMPDPDATARTGWAKFMDESSYGLSVSAFPRFIIPDVEGYPTLPLSAVDVRNPKRWEAITSAVRDQLDWWKATLQERIERQGKAKRRSAEDAAQLKRDKATLKQLQTFDGWTYQAFVEAMLPGRKPDPRDLDNLRLYRLSNGQLIPITNLGRDQLRVDFWRRLLSLWDGPVDKRAELVRGFLDHHHLTGGKAEVFRDLVKDTAARLRGMVSKGASLRDAERWGLLADKLEGWLSDAAERLTATLSRPAPYVFVTGAGGEQWSKEAHLPIMEQRQGPMEPVTASMEQLSTYVNTYYLGPLGGMPPLAVTPFGTAWDGGKPMDLPNPFRIADNWKGTGKPALLFDTTAWIQGDVSPSEVGPALMWQFREEVLQRWNGSLGADPSLRRQLVRYYLDHHATNGGRESAFVEVVEALFLSDAPPAPRDVAERIAKGELKSTVPDGLKTEVRAWIEERRKVVAKAKQPQKDAPKPLKERFPKPEQYARFIELLQEHEIVDAGGAFIHGHGRKSRLFGAYQGASENPALRFSTGSLHEIVATLNGAFSNLKLSAGKPQDLHGTKGHTKMRKAFKEALFPR
ncbi:MAG: hypothetical protein K8H89_06315 [Flavobacteriales bacterium]|nr:hypothetical protein [Flavobacteriales bacterium]